MPQWGWILIFWFLFLGLSNLGILAYGEMEFWLSLSVASFNLFILQLLTSFKNQGTSIDRLFHISDLY